MTFFRKIIQFAAIVMLIAACTPRVRLRSWAPDVRRGLNDFIVSTGPGEYAVFDFDNTCSIFDISEQLMIYQLETMSFAMSPERFQEVFPYFPGLYDSLWVRYGPFTAEGVSPESATVMHEDPLWKRFSLEMARSYFTLQKKMSADEAYRKILGWFTGMTAGEVYDMSVRSHRKYSTIETTLSTWEAGDESYSWIDGVGVTRNIVELWRALHRRGCGIWVCSASEITPVMAAVDVFGLHDYCTGVVAICMERDSLDRYGPAFDNGGCAFLAGPDGTWVRDTLPMGSQPIGPGKVDAILGSIAPGYGGRGPSAGFMDATGDFNFCTEFASMRLCVCFNRASRKVTDGGGLIAEVAMYEKDFLGYDLAGAGAAGDTYYLLQGRDENGLRTLRPSNATIRFGESSEKLFAGEENQLMLNYFRSDSLSVRDILDTYSIRTPADAPGNPFGFAYGFLERYDGDRSREDPQNP